MEPIRRDTVVRGLMEHTSIRDYRVAEIVLDRLQGVSATDNSVQLLQRLNPSRFGRCPCCGMRAGWQKQLAEEDIEAIMSQTPED